MAQSVTQTIRHVGKSHVDYWTPRLIKRTYLDSEGREVEIPEWYVRIAHLGRREWFNTGTPNKAAAAEKARKIYLSLISKGWQATLDEFKPDMQVSKDGCTVGEFLDQVKAVSGLKPVTYEIYAKKFRSLVAGVFKIDGGRAKFDYVNGGHKEWLDRIHTVRLDRLTPDRVNDWKVRELKAASKSPLQLKRTSVTVNSILRGSKALFTPDIRKHLTLRLPSPLPFEGVTLPEVGRSRYKSEIEPALLLTAAKRELAEGIQGENQPANPRPELFKIILLGLGAGLRRNEIDKLEWNQIQWHRETQSALKPPNTAAPDPPNPRRTLTLTPACSKSSKTYMPKPGKGSPFVIESPVEPRPESARYHHYRCNRHFKELVNVVARQGHQIPQRASCPAEGIRSVRFAPRPESSPPALPCATVQSPSPAITT